MYFFSSKLNAIKTIIPGNVDIMIVNPIAQLLINGFAKPFLLDRNAYGSGILIYVRSA